MSSTIDPSRPTRALGADQRRRRRVLAIGALGIVGLGGAFEGIPRIERDLERRVEADLVAAGITGVSASFSGQDATLRCDAVLSDPDAAIALAEAVRGVRIAELDGTCGGAASAGADAASDTTEAADTTEAPARTDVPATADAPATTEVPDTTEATEATDGTPATTEVAATGSGPDVTVDLADGGLVLRGTVPDEATRARLVAAAEAVVDPANVDDQLVIDAAVGGDPTAVEAAVDGLAGLIDVMPVNLVSGTARLAEGELTLEGVYLDDAALAAAKAAAGASDATTTLTAREDASASDAAALADELNALVAADPILFEPNSAILTNDANAIVERVAAVAKRFTGVAIEVIGHTDSDGDPARNLDLSERRATAVQDALVERGVSAAFTATGRGETEPVLSGGVEDKAASRRVVFAVVTA